MIIAASVIYFKSEHYDDLVLFLKEYKNIEMHEKDIDEGKLVITIEAENNEDIENITTEYEDKFISQGLKIYRCEAQKVINTLK